MSMPYRVLLVWWRGISDRRHADGAARSPESSYLPDAAASRVLTVTESGPAAAGLTVLTEGDRHQGDGAARHGCPFRRSAWVLPDVRRPPSRRADRDQLLESPARRRPRLHARRSRREHPHEGTPPGSTEDHLRVHVPRGRTLHVLLYNAAAGDERTDSGLSE